MTMHLLTAFPLLCLATPALAGVLDLFTRDRCLPNQCYRAVRSVNTAAADCYLPTLPAYASSCRDTSKFNSACACLGIPAVPPISTVAADPAISLVPGNVVDAVTTTLSSTVTTTTTITIALASTPTCVSTTVTATVTSSVTMTMTMTVTATASPGLASAVAQVVVQPSTCLSDTQATNIVNAFHNMLTNIDRSSVNATAADLIADEYFEMSGSINSLEGQGVTNITFPSRAAYLASLSAAPAITSLITLDVFHDCNRIAWYWAVTGIGSGADEVRGVSLLYTIPVALEAVAVAVTDTVGTVSGSGNAGSVVGAAGYGNRKVNMVMLEFNAVAWAADTGRVLCAGGCVA